MKAHPPAGFGISGRYGSFVFVVRGRTTYARRYTKPSDPQSAAQRQHRGLFIEAVQAWRELGQDERERFNKRAKKAGRTGYNLFVGEFLASRKAVE